ncbi:hypothetical protein D8S78_00270 [Natrialba swarupiae]|nr:hypothetical protein [Natrialba swarupiae]
MAAKDPRRYGAIGVASVGAGLGTTAYFSDQEEFTGNTLTAGTLAIKVDWQQRYWGAPPEVRPQDYATTANEAGETVSNYPHVNAFPDDSGDGEQDLGGSSTPARTRCSAPPKFRRAVTV